MANVIYERWDYAIDKSLLPEHNSSANDALEIIRYKIDEKTCEAGNGTAFGDLAIGDIYLFSETTVTNYEGGNAVSISQKTSNTSSLMRRIWTSAGSGLTKAILKSHRRKTTKIDEISAPDGTYPADGIDGDYWYINKGADPNRVVDEVVRETVPYTTQNQNNTNEYTDYSQIIQAGVNGEDDVTYTVTYVNNVETSRVEKSRVTITAMVPQITEVGTKPIETTGTETLTESIPHGVTYQDTDELYIGQTRVISEGVDGKKSVTYVVYYTKGVETHREATSETITRQPVNAVVERGTSEAPNIWRRHKITYTDETVAYTTPELLPKNGSDGKDVDPVIAESLQEQMDSLHTAVNELPDHSDTITTLITNQTTLEQRADAFELTVKEGGGLNLLKNSVGYAGTKYWDTSGVTTTVDNWMLTDTVSKHGFAFTGNPSNMLQNVPLKSNVNYTLAFSADVPPGMTLKCDLGSLNELEEFEYTTAVEIAEEGIFASRHEFTATGIMSVKFTVTGEGEQVEISDIMLSQGNSQDVWTQANGEIYTMDVLIDEDGLSIFRDDGSKTVMSPLEFAGYYQDERVFSLNKDITEVAGLLVKNQGLYIPPVKMVQNANVSLDIVWTGG